MAEDTISAIATAVGEGSIGIIRLSGSKAMAIAEQLFCAKNQLQVKEIPSHKAVYGTIVDKAGAIVDEALLLPMYAPHSYTREDVVELHCHGGAVALGKALQLTLEAGARLAEPGEFTKRAFLNGRLDLTQAEAVMEVIRAKSDASLSMAAQHLSGLLGQRIQEFRQQLLAMLAEIEAVIDFPEEDLEDTAARQVAEKTKALTVIMEKLLASAHSGRILQEGLRTAIIGKPNVGKSSLLNALLQEKRAIVTDIPGTTRDSIEEFVNVGGIPLRLIDTAGIRQTDDQVEQLGVERATRLIEQADMIWLILDGSQELTEEDQHILELLVGRPVLVLRNKKDLPGRWEESCLQKYGWPVITLSVLSGEGLSELEQALRQHVYGGWQPVARESAILSNVRHIELLTQARQHLLEAQAAAEQFLPSDCIAIDLQAGLSKLDEITGQSASEDLLREIFSRFCIGK